MNVNVPRDRIMIKPVVNEAVSSGGIVFTHTGEEKTNEGTVVAVGPGRTTDEDVLIPIDVKVGDKIIHDAGTGITVKLDGESYLVLKEENIIGVYTE